MNKILQILLLSFFMISISFASVNPYSTHFSSSVNEKLDTFIINLEQIQRNTTSVEYNLLLDNLSDKLKGLVAKYPDNELILNLVNYFNYEIKELKDKIGLIDNLVEEKIGDTIEPLNTTLVEVKIGGKIFKIETFETGEYILNNDIDYDGDGEIEGCNEEIDSLDIDNCMLYVVEEEYYITPFKDEKIMSTLRDEIYCDQLEIGNMVDWIVPSNNFYKQNNLIKYNEIYPYYFVGGDLPSEGFGIIYSYLINLDSGKTIEEINSETYREYNNQLKNAENNVRCISYKNMEKNLIGKKWGKEGDYKWGYFNWGYDVQGKDNNIELLSNNKDILKKINIKISGKEFKIEKNDIGEYILWDNIDYDGDGELEGCNEEINSLDIDNCILYNYNNNVYISPFKTDKSDQTYLEASKYCQNLEIGNWKDWILPVKPVLGSSFIKHRNSGSYFSQFYTDGASPISHYLIDINEIGGRRAHYQFVHENNKTQNTRCIRIEQVHHIPCLAEACNNSLLGSGDNYKNFDGKIYTNTISGGGRYIVNDEKDYDGNGKVEGCRENLDGYDENKCTLYIKKKNIYIYIHHDYDIFKIIWIILG